MTAEHISQEFRLKKVDETKWILSWRSKTK